MELLPDFQAGEFGTQQNTREGKRFPSRESDIAPVNISAHNLLSQRFSAIFEPATHNPSCSMIQSAGRYSYAPGSRRRIPIGEIPIHFSPPFTRGIYSVQIIFSRSDSFCRVQTDPSKRSLPSSGGGLSKWLLHYFSRTKCSLFVPIAGAQSEEDARGYVRLPRRLIARSCSRATPLQFKTKNCGPFQTRSSYPIGIDQ